MKMLRSARVALCSSFHEAMGHGVITDAEGWPIYDCQGSAGSRTAEDGVGERKGAGQVSRCETSTSAPMLLPASAEAARCALHCLGRYCIYQFPWRPWLQTLVCD